MRNSNNSRVNVKRETEVRDITEQILQLSIRRASLLNEEERPPAVAEENSSAVLQRNLPNSSSHTVNSYSSAEPSRLRGSATAYVPPLLQRRVVEQAPGRVRQEPIVQRSQVPTLQQVRARVQRQQYTREAQQNLEQYRVRCLRRRRFTDPSIPAYNHRRNIIYIGDRVRARTEGRSHTNIGVVNRFSRDRSRVFFIDFRGAEQQRAPHNLIVVDNYNE